MSTSTMSTSTYTSTEDFLLSQFIILNHDNNYIFAKNYQKYEYVMKSIQEHKSIQDILQRLSTDIDLNRSFKRLLIEICEDLKNSISRDKFLEQGIMMYNIFEDHHNFCVGIYDYCERLKTQNDKLKIYKLAKYVFSTLLEDIRGLEDIFEHEITDNKKVINEIMYILTLKMIFEDKDISRQFNKMYGYAITVNKLNKKVV